MRFNKALAKDVRAKVKDASPTRQAYVERLLADYETACVLSRGPIKTRSAHWQAIAGSLLESLESIAGYKVPLSFDPIEPVLVP